MMVWLNRNTYIACFLKIKHLDMVIWHNCAELLILTSKINLTFFDLQNTYEVLDFALNFKENKQARMDPL